MTAVDVLRAAVYRAVAARDNPAITEAGYTAALQVVVDVHVTAPLHEAEEAIARAKAELAESARRRDEVVAVGLAALRETNHLVRDETMVLAELEALTPQPDDSCSVCRRPTCRGGPDCVKVGRRRLWRASNPVGWTA